MNTRISPTEPDPEVKPELAALAQTARELTNSRKLESLLRKQALIAVAVGEPISVVAATAGVSRPTIYKWLEETKRGD